MKVVVLSKQVYCPGVAKLPTMFSSCCCACGSHWEDIEMGQLQFECFSLTSKPQLLFHPPPTLPPSPFRSNPLFSLILKGSKMVTRFKAEASKMLNNRPDKGVFKGWSLIHKHMIMKYVKPCGYED